ncbi:MAG: nitrate reductase, partial [Lachnospiraceae bacterium]|nr:nitrate reductase [Lachnospiraceae bacterium]
SFLEELEKRKIEIISVPEAAIFMHGCNLQALGNHRVLSLKRNSLVNAELSKRGMDVIELDITEILKAGGGPHCMTFPLERI